jgi:hypothetical protein
MAAKQPEQFALPLVESAAPRLSRVKPLTVKQKEILATLSATPRWVMDLGPGMVRRLKARELVKLTRRASGKARAVELTPKGKQALVNLVQL